MNDIIIIGSGPGGYKTAEYAAKKGLTVIVFEKEHAGGTCLNCGCIPTKTFCRNAEILRDLKEGELYGLSALSYNLDFAQVADRKNHVVEQLRAGIETLMSHPDITFVKAEAKIKDAHTVVADGQEYQAKNLIIATGSQTKYLPIPGLDLPGVVDSTGMLNLREVPKRLCIIGAGVIGMEFASCFSQFGSEVTVIEFLKECLPVLDSDIAKRLRKQINAEFYMQSGVKGLSPALSQGEGEGTPIVVTFEKKGKEQSVEADLVLVATGRKPNLEGYGLENLGVETGRQGIVVDDNMQTSVGGVYAIGDVNGRCMLAHAAEMQGMHCVNHILGIEDNIRLDIMPSAIFTLPEAACVGLSEDACKEQGLDYECRKSYYRSNGKALAMNETDGMLKLMVEKESGRVLGCHVYGAHAADLVQEVSVLMCKGATTHELVDMIHIHPTLSEVLRAAVE